MSACAAWLPSGNAREVLDEVAQQRVGEAVLVRPLGVAEDAVERFRVRLLDAAQGRLQRLPDVGGHRSHIAPVATFRDLEAVVLREAGVFLVAPGLLQREFTVRGDCEGPNPFSMKGFRD